MATPRSLSREILTAVAVTVATALLLSALVTAYVASSWLERTLLDYVDRNLQQVALRSRLAFKAEDKEAEALARQAVQVLPGTRSVELVSQIIEPATPVGGVTSLSVSGKRWQDRDGIHYLIPIDDVVSSNPFELSSAKPVSGRRLGYLHVVFDGALFTTVNKVVYLTNVIIGLLCATTLILVLKRRVQQTLVPVNRLVATMGHAGERPGVRADLKGPTEVQEIATVFNDLMAKQDNQRAILEAEVSHRTTELREARDAALSLSKLKSTFISTLSHEINTPSTVVSTYLELALENIGKNPDQERLQDWLKRAYRSIKQLQDLFKNTMDHAQIEAGKSEVHPSQVDLHALASTLEQSVQPFAENQQNTLLFELRGPATVTIDEGKLYHILLNLLTNACKFTEAGTVRLLIDHQPTALLVTVTDTGRGIPSDQQAKIFEQFHRVEVEDTPDPGGIGLGLAITQQFCKMLNGEIDVESTVGQGSTFRVHIPLPVKFGSEQDSEG